MARKPMLVRSPIPAIVSVFMVVGFCTVPTRAEQILLDKRNQSEQQDYYVRLCSKKASSLGHCYVGTSASQPNQAPNFKYQGFYGQLDGTAEKWHLIVPGVTVPGSIETESFQPADCLITVKVNKATFDAARGLIEVFSHRRYNLTKNDCVTLCDDIASQIGIKHPADRLLMTPRDYVNATYLSNFAERLPVSSAEASKFGNGIVVP